LEIIVCAYAARAIELNNRISVVAGTAAIVANIVILVAVTDIVNTNVNKDSMTRNIIKSAV